MIIFFFNSSLLFVNAYEIFFSIIFFDLKKGPKIRNNLLDNILDNSLSMGPNVLAFQKEFATKINVKHAIAMNACTSTLEAALLAHDIKGKEVIIPSQTFIGTGMSVHLNGAIPVFAEISHKTFCLDLDDVKKKVTKNTAGIILVHMTGIITPNILDFKNYPFVI